MTETLHVVTPVSNPHGWASRIALARRAVASWQRDGASVTVVECAYGSRRFDLADMPGIRHVGVRAQTLAWNKENLLNIGIARLPPDAAKIVTADADITFRKSGWVEATLRALDLYPVIQPWADAYDLGPHDEHMQHHLSFARQYFHGHPVAPRGANWWKYNNGPYGYPHSGYAWAWRREFLDLIGGLLEWAGMGSADHHMALGLVGAAAASVPNGTSPAYLAALHLWEARARQHMNGKMGFLWQTIEHPFHGAKAKRKYVDRWDMFLRHGFDPHTDLKKNSHGVIEFAGNKPDLEREFDRYLRSRDEDANSIG